MYASEPDVIALMSRIRELILEEAENQRTPVDEVVDTVISKLYDWMYEEEDM